MMGNYHAWFFEGWSLATVAAYSAKERSLLIALHRKEKQRKVGDRIKIILLLDKGWSYEKISGNYSGLLTLKSG